MQLVEYTLDTAAWGRVQLVRPLPTEAHPTWGALSPLLGTVYAPFIPTIPGDTLAHALHGHATPLVRLLGSPPHALLKQVPSAHRTCAQSKGCHSYDPKVCHPCPKLPDCYSPPSVQGNPPLSDEAQQAATTVLLAWRDGKYVIVVGGGEFAI